MPGAFAGPCHDVLVALHAVLVTVCFWYALNADPAALEVLVADRMVAAANNKVVSGSGVSVHPHAGIACRCAVSAITALRKRGESSLHLEP